MVEPPFFSATTAEKLKGLRQRGFSTTRYFHEDAYTAWAILRPVGATSWDAGTAGEEWESTGSGTGKLYENGAGGPVSGETVIEIESPYRFRTLTTAGFIPDTTILVINGTRMFRVTAFKVEDTRDRLTNAYLEEVFGRTFPVVTP